jgi:alpha-L-fucosidase 2
MPIGNGDIGVNAWVAQNGDLMWYVAKTDAWDEQGRPLKLGKMRLKLDPVPFAKNAPYVQRLDLQRGMIRIGNGLSGPEGVSMELWVDAHQPVVWLEVRSGRPLSSQLKVENWRTSHRILKPEEAHGVDQFSKDELPFATPDLTLSDRPDEVLWCHVNQRSIWRSTLEHQDLGGIVDKLKDPLLGRVFGGCVRGEGVERTGDPWTLSSQGPMRYHRYAVVCRTLSAPNEASGDGAEALWKQQVRSDAERALAGPVAAARKKHEAWWKAFWSRSWIVAEGRGEASAAEARLVTQSYALQRFISACAGRGAFPIKFNGSLFTVEAEGKYDADFRMWGGGYWFQNTRLPYWPMLAAGDFEQMLPLFRMYLDALPLARLRTEVYYHHAGAFFPETMHFWGTYQNGDMGYGWEREGQPRGRAVNEYIRYYWSGGLELLAMMEDYYAFTLDSDFLQSTFLPLADGILEFYQLHYPREPNGRILFAPSQALETWWTCENPMPEVAGLRCVLDRALHLPSDLVGGARLARWRELLQAVPPIPKRGDGDQERLLPAESFRNQKNMENPELYAVFPYRIFGVGKPELELARHTFDSRQFKGHAGWQQDDTQAAFLGLTEVARRGLVQRFSTRDPASRFPAFWGPNFDWVPDQDHGGNGLMTLQSMLLQHERDRILLLPAWPSAWDVNFRLRAPRRTLVTGRWVGGRLVETKVRPAARARDMELSSSPQAEKPQRR